MSDGHLYSASSQGPQMRYMRYMLADRQTDRQPDGRAHRNNALRYGYEVTVIRGIISAARCERG